MSDTGRTKAAPCIHPRLSRRTAIQAGGIGLLGLGMNHVAGLREMAVGAETLPKPKAVIYIFLSGGLTQHDSFDPKPDAPATKTLFLAMMSSFGPQGARYQFRDPEKMPSEI